MNEQDWLAERFDANKPQLRAVAYRMLGSLSEVDDAVQEAWLRLSRTDARGIENLGAWLTTVVGRVCLDMLRSRRSRGETPLAVRLPDPLVDPVVGIDPEHEALLADSVGLALLVVLETLSPPSGSRSCCTTSLLSPSTRSHRSSIAPPRRRDTLASRARRRVRAARAVPDADLATQREVVGAFLAAARDGDFDRLVAVLDPEIVLRADAGRDGGSLELRGAAAVARRALGYAQLGLDIRPALVNGVAGAVTFLHGQPFSIAAAIVRNRKIVELDILTAPERLRLLDLTLLDE